jgi:hypothetical protein
MQDLVLKGHSRYRRRVANGPSAGRPVVVCLTVRRLLRQPRLAAVTFGEQAEGLTGRYLQRSLPRLELLTQVGVASRHVV